MQAQREGPESFVLVYADDGDPSREETAQALNKLKAFTPEEVLPGTIRVVGERREVEQRANSLDHWQLSTEKFLGLNPPHKLQVR